MPPDDPAAAPPRIDFDSVAVGERLPPVSFVLDPAVCAAYQRATGPYPAAPPRLTAPPLLLVALALAAMTERMPLPPSALHVGQELTFLRAAASDCSVDAQFWLDARRRAGASTVTAFGVELSVAGEPVVVGRVLLRQDATEPPA
jgi:hypothetical protein